MRYYKLLLRFSIVVLLVALLLFHFGCKPQQVVTTQTVTVTKTDTLREDVIKNVPIPCDATMDTTINIFNKDSINIHFENNQLDVTYIPGPEETTITTTESIPASVYKKMIKQEQMTARTAIRQQERSFRDSMDNIRKMYKQEINGYQDSLKQARRMHNVDKRQEARVEVAKSKGGFFARIKNALFWLVVGIAIGLTKKYWMPGITKLIKMI